MSEPGVAVSAPGKVLFAGGFLVLDRQHTGLVFGLDARIHIHIQTRADDTQLPKQIVVRSPQFEDALWAYTYDTAKGDLVEVIPLPTNSSANKFVATTLAYALTYLHHLPSSKSSRSPTKPLARSLNITILADDDYYSTQSSLKEPGKFTKFGVPLSGAHKTGLGSSAALVTALTSALLVALSPSLAVDGRSFPIDLQKKIHNLAQAAHCAAQGKVGSGFDVAAAVYGSCLYRRFTPAILESLGDSHLPGFGERLHRCVDDLDPDHAWDVEVQSHAVRVPESLRLVMCDVDCGSETPGMVKKVLKWRSQSPVEAGLLWDALQTGTEDLCQEMKRLGAQNDNYTGLRDIILTIRSLVRDMSDKSGVPIEPKVQTALLDACSSIPGVVGGVCPGAGGYDAVALLIRNDEDVLLALRNMLTGWKSVTEEGSGATIGNVNLLGVKQGVEGARIEDPARYYGWTEPS